LNHEWKEKTVVDINKIKEGVSLAAMEYPIRKASLFGSYAEGQAHSGSDVDLQVEFVTKSVSLLTLNALKYRLEEILGIDVDVIHGPLSEDSMLVLRKVVPVYES